jgi:aminotransferase/cystathionine beta-lyase
MEVEFFLDEGYIFGSEGSGYERINLAAPTHVIEKALERLEKALKKV